MGEDKSGKFRGTANRPVLRDISNQLGKKRGFSEVSSCPKSHSKSGCPNERPSELNSSSSSSSSSSIIDDDFRKRVSEAVDKLKHECCSVPNCPNYVPETPLSPLECGRESAFENISSDSNDVFFKRVRVLVENMKRQPCGSGKCPKVTHEEDASVQLRSQEIDLGLSGNVGGSLVANTQKGSHDSVIEVKEPSGSVLDSVDQDEVQVLPNNANASDTSVQTWVPNLAVAEKSETCERNDLEAGKVCQSERTVVDVVEIDSSQSDLAAEDTKDDDKVVCVDYLASSRSESAVNSKLMEPLDRQSFQLERCTALSVHDSYSSAAGLDSIKSCSCSFCTKAAYIWSDLHYQEVKGRLSILMKSKIEASNLAQRYSSDNAVGKQDVGSFNETAQLEIDLMNQWKSLFLHMENVFVDESTQLQTNFLALKDLRDDFKMNLESINGMHSYVQTCSSDASDHRRI